MNTEEEKGQKKEEFAVFCVRWITEALQDGNQNKMAMRHLRILKASVVQLKRMSFKNRKTCRDETSKVKEVKEDHREDEKEKRQEERKKVEERCELC